MPFETKAYDLRSFAVLSLSCLRNAISGWTLFLSSWVTEMLRMLLDSAVFFFMAIYVAPSAAQYGGDLRSLAVMAAVLLPVGFFLFLRGLKRAGRFGEFTRWT